MAGKWEVKNGTATYKVDDVIVAKITNLASGVTNDANGAIDGITVTEAETAADGTVTPGTITLDKKVLGAKEMKLTLSNDGNYKLNINASDCEVKNINSYWSYKNGTASLLSGSTEGWTLSTDKTSISYTAAKAATLASVSGLEKTNVVVSDDNKSVGVSITTGEGQDATTTYTPGLSVSGTVITVSANMLSTSKVTLKNGKDANGTATSYSLALDTTTTAGGKVPTAAENVYNWSYGATSTYKNASTAYYTLSGTTISYTAEKKLATLATIKGLNKDNANAENIIVNSDGTITIKAAALDGKSVTLSNGKDASGVATSYKIKLEDDNGLSPTLTNAKWTVKNGTATLTAEIGEDDGGYTLSADGKTLTWIAPTKSGKTVTLATVKGLVKDAEKNGDYNGIDSLEDDFGIKVTEAANGGIGTITVSNDTALSNTNVTLSSSSYKLTLDSGVPGENVPEEDVWDISGTTATFKRIKPAYYTYDTAKGSVVYHKPTDVEIYATVKGLKKGLTVVDASEVQDYDTRIEGWDETASYAVMKDENENIIGIITVDSGTQTISLPKGVLGTSNVTFDTKNTEEGYKFELYKGSEGTENFDPVLEDGKDPVWSLSKTTATLKGDMTLGYSLSSDGKTVNYIKAAKNAVLATVKGLSSDVTSVKNSDGTVDIGTGKGEDFKGEGLVYDTDERTITIAEELLGTTDIVVEGNGNYTISDSSGYTAPEEGFTWKVNGTTASLNTGTSDGFILSTDAKTLKYSGATYDYTIATISGLKSGLSVKDGQVGTYDEEENFVQGITLGHFKTGVNNSGKTVTTTEFEEADLSDSDFNLNNEKVIQLSENVFGTTKVTIPSTSTYTLTVDYEPNEDTTVAWRISERDAAAYLVKYTPRNYTIDKSGKTISYTPASFGETLATVKGLKSGLTVDENGQIAGIEVNVETDSETGAITGGSIELDDRVLDKKDLTLTNEKGNAFAFALYTDTETGDDGVEKLVENGVEESTLVRTWGIKSGTATLTETSGKGYQLSDDELSINYYNKVTAVKTTISGLDKNLSEENVDEIDGITANYTTGVITLDDAVLGGSTSAVTLKGNFTLALAQGSGAQIEDPVLVKTSVKDTKAYYQQSMGAGHVVTDDPKKLNYIKADTKPTVLATLNGIIKTYTTEDVDGNTGTFAVGYITEDSSASDKEAALENDIVIDDVEHTITINNRDILAASNVSLGAKDGYNLAIDEDAFGIQDVDMQWSLNAEKGTAAIVSGKSAGWGYKTTTKSGVTTTDTKTLVYKKADYTNLATISGLVKATKDEPDPGYTTGEYENEAIKDLISYTAPTTDENGNVTALGTIKLSDDIVGESSKVSLGKNDNYKFVFASGFEGAAEQSDNVWSVNNGTAKYQYTTSDGYVISVDGKTVTKETKEKTTVLTTISGINKSLTTYTTTDDKGKKADEPVENFADVTGWPEDGDSDASEEDTQRGIVISKDSSGNPIFTLDKDVLSGSSKVTIKGEGKLALDSSALPTAGYDQWVLKGTTATLYKSTTSGFTIDDTGKTITSVKAVNGDPILSITGLKKGLSTYVDEDGKSSLGVTVVSGKTKEFKPLVFVRGTTVELASDALGTTDITLDSLGSTVYRFDVDTNVITPPDEGAPTWDVKSGTATLKQTVTQGFTLDSNSTTLSYTAAQNGVTLATVKGLNKDLTADNIGNYVSVENNVITVKEGALIGSKVTATPGKGYSYTLKLDDGVPQTAEEVTEWVTNNTTAVKKTYKKGYYSYDANTNSIIYNKESAATETFATVSGIKKGVALSDNNGVITLGINELNGSKVTLKNGTAGGYTLALDTETLGVDDEELPVTEKTDLAWSYDSKGTTGTLKGTLTKGYSLAADKLSIAYSKTDKTGQKFATVKGLAVAELDTPDGTLIDMTGPKLSSKVTVDGEGYNFGFNDYYESSITGGSKGDSISVGEGCYNLNISTGAGNDSVTMSRDSYGISVNGGKGNDYADFAKTTGDTSKANFFVYASGDGDDVIVNFMPDKDFVKVTKGTVDKATYNSNDTILSIDNKGTITLKGMAKKTVTVLDSKDNVIGTYTSTASNSSAAPLFDDDNFTTTTPQQLTDLVNSGNSNYSISDLNSSQDITSLTTNSNVIAYSGDDK